MVTRVSLENILVPLTSRGQVEGRGGVPGSRLTWHGGLLLARLGHLVKVLLPQTQRANQARSHLP